jgi:hypothetical protein
MSLGSTIGGLNTPDQSLKYQETIGGALIFLRLVGKKI